MVAPETRTGVAVSADVDGDGLYPDGLPLDICPYAYDRGLDSELRGILKEKGLRDHDPFEAIVMDAVVLDMEEAKAPPPMPEMAGGRTITNAPTPTTAQRRIQGRCFRVRTAFLRAWLM